MLSPSRRDLIYPVVCVYGIFSSWNRSQISFWKILKVIVAARERALQPTCWGAGYTGGFRETVEETRTELFV